MNKNFFFALSIFAFAVGLASNAVLFSQQKVAELFYTADALYFPELFRDLVTGGGELKNWYLQPAPNFFPDAFVYFPIRAVIENWLFAWAVFGLIQIFALLALSFRLLNLVYDRKTAATWTMAGSSLILLLAPSGGDPYFTALLGGHHFGTAVGVIACIVITAELFRKWRRSLLVSLGLLVFLLAFSDRLLIMHFVLPLVVWTLIDYAAGLHSPAQRRTLTLVSLTSFLSGVLAFVAYEVLIPHRTVYAGKLAAKKIALNLQVFLKALTDLSQLNSFALAICLIVSAAFIFQTLRLIYFNRRKQLDSRQLIIIQLAVSLAVVFGMLTLLSSIELTPRYWIPFTLIPFIATPLAFGEQRLFKAGLVALFACAIPWSATTVFAQIKQPEKISAAQSFINCFDLVQIKHDLRWGVAQYWDTKPLRFLSASHVNVAPYHKVDNRLEEFNWISSVNWFTDAYDFAVVDLSVPKDSSNYIDPLLLKIRAGAPDTIEQCPGHEIHVYKRAPLRLAKH